MNTDQGEQLTQTNYLPLIVTSAIFALPALTGSLVGLCFLTPLPVFYYLLSLGPEQGTKIVSRAAIISGLVAIFVKVLPIQLFSLTFVPVGFILAHGVKSGTHPWTAGLKAVIGLGVIWLLMGVTISSAHDANIYKEIISNIDAGLAAAYQSYKASASIPVETLLEVEAAFTELRKLVPRVFPGVILMTVIFTIWVNIVVGDWLLKKKKSTLACWPDFRQWRLPEPLVWVFIAAAVLLFVSNELLNNIGLNGLLIMGLIYFFQGLAVITFLFAKWSVPTPVKFLLYMLLVIQAYGMIILAGLGIADVWLNFRRPRTASDEEE